jgi:hypothetical protein
MVAAPAYAGGLTSLEPGDPGERRGGQRHSQVRGPPSPWTRTALDAGAAEGGEVPIMGS